MPSDTLPARPNLDQLRRRAEELRDAARTGDPGALARITAHTPSARPGTVALAAAQLAIAREHGHPSWPQLVAEVQARTAEAGQLVEEFLVASIRDWTGRAVRMLARDPWIAGYDFRTAVILGDVVRVREMLARDPELPVRQDTRTGWTALQAACASRWHRLDPARADGLTEVARLLLAAGADPAARPPGGLDGQGGQWWPLLCAVAGAPNPAITPLLLEHGARPDDHVLYLAAFDDDHECLRLLLPYARDIASTTALSAPISTGDVSELERLARSLGASPDAVLAELAEADAIVFNDHCEIRAAYPFSPVHTPIRVSWRGSPAAYAMCAIDALGMSTMLGHPVTITAAEPDTGRVITVSVNGSRARWRPRSAAVFVGSAGDTGRPSVDRSCGYINFFASGRSARAWAGRHREVTGRLLTREGALGIGIAEFGNLLRAVPAQSP